MFEKHRNSKQDPDHIQAQQDSLPASGTPSLNTGRAAVIGPGIQVKGDITGDENLVIEGKVIGKIKLEAHQVDISPSGHVHADITAKVIKVAGEVHGDLIGLEKVVLSRSGNIHGNIVAPRMTLEDGAIFKGSIDMDPGEPEKPVVVKSPVKTAAGKASGKATEPAKVMTGGKSKDGAAYSLNGS